MTLDEQIARAIDGKQYGTIRTKAAGRYALERMLFDLEHADARAANTFGTGARLAADLRRAGLLGAARDAEAAVMELDHAGWPAVAREFADLLQEVRAASGETYYDGTLLEDVDPIRRKAVWAGWGI